ncbi:MAG: glycosyltransferase family 4 protein [Gemmatimonadetes bacterium]|nr:glycosyltransferase family 4 protein [Gemmatimonadota bacterium]
MRILLIVRSFAPEVNSVAVLYGQLAAALAERGHTVTVLTRSPQTYLAGGETAGASPASAAKRRADVAVRRVPTLPVPGWVPLLRGFEQVCTAGSFLASALLARRHDVALVYSPPLPYALPAGALRALRGTPFVLNVQDLYPQTATDLGLLRNPLLIRAAKALERFAYRNAAHIVVHSEGNRRHVIAHGAPAGKVSVIPNWVDTESIAPGPRDNGFRLEHRLDSRFVVSFAGVMGFAQGLGTVIEAADLLRGRDDIVFVLIGDGVRRGPLEAEAARRRLTNVRFVPLQPPERYAQVLAASDACLVTLDARLKVPVVPGKLQSIMAAGRPVVASVDAGGDVPRIVAEADCGIVVDPADPSTLAEAVLRLQGDPQLRERMGRNGRAYALRHYSREKAVERYLEELQAAARASGRTGEERSR